MTSTVGNPVYFVGVDVGTSSVRAALVSGTGQVIRVAVEPIKIWNPCESFYEQSSDDIWRACCKTVKQVTSDDLAESVQGIGFDATCSLVALDKELKPLSVSQSGDNERNIIMWMDHRAKVQAERINKAGHEALRFTGGEISLEMEPPKLLWLKENLFEACWQKAGTFMDLADFMTWRATGSQIRSLCTVVCKWMFQANDTGLREWNSSFYESIGLKELLEDQQQKIGNLFQLPGDPCGDGLSHGAAEELGLRPGLPVGTGIIDAYAGGIGMLGADVSGLKLPCETRPLTSRLALICGTSTCHMSLSKKETFVPGVWGPYYSCMVPGLWGNEGGESCTGKLIDHIIHTHPAVDLLTEQSKKRGCDMYTWLDDQLMTMAREKHLSSPAMLTRDLHVCPYFYGNRSPLADPTLKGMICGLRLSSSLDDLALLYLATLQALAHGTHLIVQQMVKSGYDISTLFACGGLCKSDLFLQTHADVTGLPIVLPKESESVLVGAAILGAKASGRFDLESAMSRMCGVGKVVWPDEQQRVYYIKKHEVFLKLVDHQREYKCIMEEL
ncbi:FGGY carbohydrate kinase domain-containing protein isoform X1 [Strongylocentrotus purpuratus]|uniref:FGGY carbohydrate kinase domain-containing protein n=2 Tax=Strongylocentrotus purpuratus TaxID=7668 RepID=A0A7M7PNB4_STRPU|nr:FGGY carbohydrate kinase domain-containing protein isoform X1 [Strongylocentrotus purpuratus]